MDVQFKPVFDALSRTYWQGVREGKLLIQRCPLTCRYQWYPRAHSIYAPQVEPEWVQASGQGSVFTWSVIHRGNGTRATPYICAVIDLDEGVLFTSTLRDVEEEDVRAGLRVQVDFEEAGPDLVLPVFKPVAKQ
jgi:uncharacterized OB-fold protein